jgi:PleD family two-component response regulator
LSNTGLSTFDGLGPEGKGVLTISGGLASFPRDGSNIEELFQQADKALLEAKRSGKNRIYLVGKPQSDITEIE